MWMLLVARFDPRRRDRYGLDADAAVPVRDGAGAKARHDRLAQPVLHHAWHPAFISRRLTASPTLRWNVALDARHRLPCLASCSVSAWHSCPKARAGSRRRGVLGEAERVLQGVARAQRRERGAVGPQGVTSARRTQDASLSALFSAPEGTSSAHRRHRARGVPAGHRHQYGHLLRAEHLQDGGLRLELGRHPGNGGHRRRQRPDDRRRASAARLRRVAASCCS